MSKIRIAQERIRAGMKDDAPRTTTPPLPLGKMASRQAASGIEAVFAEDVKSLKGLTLEAKTRLKKTLVEKYRAHATRFLASGHGQLQDAVTAHWVIWLWDTGDIQGFIENSRRAEALDQRSPFQTPLREFRWYRLLDWVSAEVKAHRSPEPYFEDVYQEVGAMPGSIASGYHTVAGKWAFWLGEQAEADGEPEEARAFFDSAKQAFERARAASPKARVETVLKQVIRKLES